MAAEELIYQVEAKGDSLYAPAEAGPGCRRTLIYRDCTGIDEVEPFGIVIEHTAEVLQVDDSYIPKGPQDWKWPPGRTEQWGAAPPKAESVKHAQLAIKFADYDPGAEAPAAVGENR